MTRGVKALASRKMPVHVECLRFSIVLIWFRTVTETPVVSIIKRIHC